MNTLISLLAGFVLAVVLFLAGWAYFGRRRGGEGARTVSVASGIEQLKAIGQLSVYKIYTKEIVTEVDHTWGEFGREYLRWILSEKKMAMIFEFEIDFRFDLCSPAFAIDGGESGYVVTMPECHHEVYIRDIAFYDEQKSKLVPWLLPDLLNSVFTGGFSERDRNRLKDAAKTSAHARARRLVLDFGSEVERSAEKTLRSLAKAFGAENVSFVFQHPAVEQLDVEFANQ